MVSSQPRKLGDQRGQTCALSEEPAAVIPHAGICEGGVGQPTSLPQSEEKSRLAIHVNLCDVPSMPHVAELLKEASKLDRFDRAELVSSLLEDLESSPHYVTDEEAMSRVDELKSGKVIGLTEEEFWTACGRP